MTIQGALFVQQRDQSDTNVKWQCWGDAQTRLDLIFSEWVSFDEMAEVPAFQRIKQIVRENGMYGLGPEYGDLPQMLGGKGYHIVFLDPRFQGREIPPPMEQIPTS